MDKYGGMVITRKVISRKKTKITDGHVATTTIATNGDNINPTTTATNGSNTNTTIIDNATATAINGNTTNTTATATHWGNDDIDMMDAIMNTTATTNNGNNTITTATVTLMISL